MVLTPVIKNDDLVVMGPPSLLNVNVDIGQAGERGSIIFTGQLHPTDNTTFYTSSNPPKAGDLYIRTDAGNYYGMIYRLASVPGGTAWQETFQIINNYVNLYEVFNSSQNYCETIFRDSIDSEFVLTSGTVYFSLFTPLENITVDTFTVISGSTPGSSLTNVQFGLYSIDYTGGVINATLLAKSESNTALLTVADTIYSEVFKDQDGFSTTYTLTGGLRYAVGIFVTGTTMPSIVAKEYPALSIAKIDPITSMYLSGQTSLPNGTVQSPTVITNESIVNPYVRLS